MTSLRKLLGGTFEQICDKARELHELYEQAAHDTINAPAEKIKEVEHELNELWQKRREELRNRQMVRQPTRRRR